MRFVRSGMLLRSVCVAVYVSSCGSPPFVSAASARVPRLQSDAPASADVQADIVVTARRGGTTVKIDRTVYDVATRDDAASLNTVDVLKKLPGLVIDPSNRVTVRGGADVGFLVDGKPVRRDVALAISASQIDRVEVLTNPSAEFDSSSGALVNLILKKDARLGWAGAVSGKVDTRGGYKAGVDVTHGGVRWNFNGNLSARLVPGRTATDRRTDYDLLQDGGYITQLFDVRERSPFHQVATQGKLTYKASDRDNVSLVVGANINANPHRDSIRETFIGPSSARADSYARIVRFNGFYPYGSLTYDSDKKDDRHLTVSLETYAGRSGDDRTFDGAVPRESRDRLSYTFVEGNAELQKSLAGAGTLIVGLTMSDNDVTDHLTMSGFSGPGETQRGDFAFDRKSYAGYVTHQGKVAGIEVKPGLRYERLAQDFKDGNGRIPGLRATARVLPSLHLARQLTKYGTLNASFSQRIEKPDALYLNPFRKYVSPYQLEQGNPFLRPSNKRQGELSYTYDHKGLFTSQALYYRDTKDDVSTYVFLAGNGVTATSYTNLGTSTAYGYSASVKRTLSKKLTLSYDVDLFHRRIAAPSSLSRRQDISYGAFTASFNLDYSPGKANSFSANIGYASRTFDLGLENPEAWNSDFQYTHYFRNRMSLTVNLIDVAVPQAQTTRFYGPGFNGVERVRRASRLIRIGLSKPL